MDSTIGSALSKSSMDHVLPVFFSSPDVINPLTYVGLLLLLSYAGGRIANFFKAPRVIGYLVTGMLLSPSMTGVLSENLVWNELDVVTHIALSVIAFSIGGSLKWSQVQRLGRQIVWITLSQGLGAISLGNLVRNVFPRSHRPQIHPRRLMTAITMENARHIMQAHCVSARMDEEIENVLQRMIKANVKEIAILDEGNKVVGDINILDLLKFLTMHQAS